LSGATGADWTILRASWGAQRFSESFLPGAVPRGDVTVPAGSSRGQRALGREPKDLANYARETAPTGVRGVQR
jgi:hypothetical protein